MKNRLRKIIGETRHELMKEFIYSFSASKPRKILFDHLPKCGGSSLNEYLEAHYPKRKTFSINGANPTASVDDFKNLPQYKRHEYDFIKGHSTHKLLAYVHPECLKVTVLREPVERIISHYYYAKSTPTHYLNSIIHNFEMSLEDYATSGLSGELQNWYTTHFSGLSVNDVGRNPEKAITKAVDVVLNQYQIVGFLDNFSAFTETLRQQAGLRYKYQNKKVNVTEHRPSLNDIPQSTIIKIEQVNHLDIAFYKKIKDVIG